MRSYPDDLAALEEEFATFKAANAKEKDALLKRNAELEAEVAKLRELHAGPPSGVIGGDLTSALRQLGHSHKAMSTDEVADLLEVKAPMARYLLEQLVKHRLASQTHIDGFVVYWAATPDGRAHLANAGLL